MGQRDISQGRYFEDNQRYADLINGFVFKGKQVISGQDIQDMDSRVTGVSGSLRQRFMVQKYRDCVRRVIFGTGVVVIGIENQDKVHYGMPIRIMMEDAASYDRQMRQIQRRHRAWHDLKGGEFLGGFSRYDRVHPVITICIYYGSAPYDGPRELFQIMDDANLPENMKLMLNNYRIHVLEIRSFQHIDCFRTDLREVFGFIQRAGDTEAARKFTFENEKEFKALEEDAFDVIVSATGSMELAGLKDTYREEGGKINMCEAIRGMIAEGRSLGLAEGQREKAYKTARNMYNRNFSVQETAALLDEDPDMISQWYNAWDKGL